MTIPSKANNRAGYILVQVENGKWITVTFVPPSTKVHHIIIWKIVRLFTPLLFLD